MSIILGINDGHCATACLLVDGKITGCVSEERFKRVKNWSGFPAESVRWLLKEAGIGADAVDKVVLNYKNSGILNVGAGGTPLSGKGPYRLLSSIYGPASVFWAQVEYQFPELRPLSERLMQVGERVRAAFLSNARLQPILELGVSKEKIVLADHHDTHIHSLLGWENLRRGEALVITVDGEGDLLAATVNVFRDGKFERIAQTSRFASLGLLYTAVTRYMAMKPLEHEYKIMGLAPYCSEYHLQKTLPVFKNLISLGGTKGLTFKTRYRADVFGTYLKATLGSHRFDAIAGALQRHTEDLLVGLVKNAIKATGICRVGLSGGVFLNVKANKRIAELADVKEMFVFPSSGDESTAIGAAYGEYFTKTGKRPEPLRDLYLGPSFDDQIAGILKEQKVGKQYRVEKLGNIEERVAELLTEGKVVARFKGRMEWGARALGNRSILADPRDPDIIMTINEQIKKRDFWMPFTPSILEERADDYLVNPKKIFAPYMIMAFDSTELAKKDLRAAMHPYDFTVRPQVVRESWNPSYHKLIKEFEKRTGVGGVLNTSFNIHGEPIVCTPEDALSVFERSGLQHLALGEYLISK